MIILSWRTTFFSGKGLIHQTEQFTSLGIYSENCSQKCWVQTENRITSETSELLDKFVRIFQWRRIHQSNWGEVTPTLLSVLWIRNDFNVDSDPDFAFYHNEDPNLDLGNQTNADPDPGQTMWTKKFTCVVIFNTAGPEPWGGPGTGSSCKF
jgi:hypothetical protein